MKTILLTMLIALSSGYLFAAETLYCKQISNMNAAKEKPATFSCFDIDGEETYFIKMGKHQKDDENYFKFNFYKAIDFSAPASKKKSKKKLIEAIRG